MDELEVRETGEAVTFRVRVVPRAGHDRIRGAHGAALRVTLTAPPVEGAANGALIRLLAKALGVPRGSVEIIVGKGSRDKTVRVHGVDAARVRALARG